jgi:hypothetical protein
MSAVSLADFISCNKKSWTLDSEGCTISEKYRYSNNKNTETTLNYIIYM